MKSKKFPGEFFHKTIARFTAPIVRDTPHKETPVKNPLAGKLEAPKMFINDVRTVRKDRKETKKIIKELQEAADKITEPVTA